jgi:hypothetical protein
MVMDGWPLHPATVAEEYSDYWNWRMARKDLGHVGHCSPFATRFADCGPNQHVL